jgi:hypothetical protein
MANTIYFGKDVAGDRIEIKHWPNTGDTISIDTFGLGFLDFDKAVAVEIANAILKAAGVEPDAQPVINVNVALAQDDIAEAVARGIKDARLCAMRIKSGVW